MRFSSIYSIYALILSIVAFSLSLEAADPIYGGEVLGSSGVRTRTIQIAGQPTAVVQQARQLFALHGGYEQVNARPDFDFTFTAVQGNSINLVIASRGQTLWQGSFSGRTQLEALYAASDVAVTKTLGTKGFFASKLAFVADRTGNSEIYTSDFLFKAVKQVTNDRSQCLSPNLSPDGNVLLYTSFHGTGFPDIYRIDLLSGRRSVFAGFRGTNTGGTFSPDGQQVAMILSGSGNAEVFVSNPLGKQLRRLTTTDSLEADPSWSPDGRRLVFTSDQLGGPQIYTASAQGRSMSRVRTDISRNCSEPTWNPVDPDQIAFTAAVGGEFEVAVFSFKEGKSRVVSSGSGDAVHPAWLNDGRHLIYTERTSRYSRLMILDTVTGKRGRLSPAELKDAREASPVYPLR